MGLGDLVGYAQAQAHSALSAGRIRLIEAFEDEWELMGRVPVSETSSCTQPFSWLTSTVTVPPSGVYFIALSRRMSATWRTRARSKEASSWSFGGVYSRATLPCAASRAASTASAATSPRS